MSFRLRAQFVVDFVGDGIGPMEVPGAQSIRILTQFSGTNAPTQGPIEGVTIVPGGNSPTQANFVTASNLCATDFQNQLAAAGSALLARIQGFSTGGS